MGFAAQGYFWLGFVGFRRVGFMVCGDYDNGGFRAS